MTKKINSLIIFFMSFVYFSTAQEANKGSFVAGSSQTTTANGTISGWVGNNVNFIDVNTSQKVTGMEKNLFSGRLENLDASLFPNPVVNTSVLTVKGISQEYTLRIFDNLGKNITPNHLSEKAFKQSSMEISFSSLPAGYFLVDILTKDGKMGKTIKILKTNN